MDNFLYETSVTAPHCTFCRLRSLASCAILDENRKNKSGIVEALEVAAAAGAGSSVGNKKKSTPIILVPRLFLR